MLSYWESNYLTETDVAIIGGGIVGLSTAASILERNPKLHVTLFERSVLPYGASTRNAGFACIGSLTEALSDIAMMGSDHTRELMFHRWLGLQITRKRLGDRAIGYDDYGGYELVANKISQADIKAVNALVADFIPNYIANSSIRKSTLGIQGEGELFQMQNEGQVNTGLLLKSLYSYVSQEGGNLLTGAEVTEIETNGTLGFVVNVKDAHRGMLPFSAKRVVVCTNAFASDLIPILDVKPGRGQVMLTEPIEGLKFRGNLHLDEGFYYIRNIGERLLIGGGRNLDFDGEASFENGLNDHIQTALEQKMNEVFQLSSKPHITQRWSGIMAFGKDKEPVVKEIRPGLFVGVKMSGMGIALAGFIGEEITDLMGI